MQYHTSNQEGGQITYCRCVFSKNLWVNHSMFGFFVYTHVPVCGAYMQVSVGKISIWTPQFF